jgi:hypothetical protein
MSVPLPGIPKCPEKDVPKGEVRIIERMYSLLVMNTMALRPLKNISKPIRRANIPVVKHLSQPAQ